jgi:hypothetical protein
MSSETYFHRYESLYCSLKAIIRASEERVLRDEPDELFMENVNFFVKSYLINICTYLEAYLQDIALMYADELDSRVKGADIPHNFVHWRIAKEIKDKDLMFKNVDLSVDKKEISDNLSGNPYKTIKLFKYLGIDLQSRNDFEENKSLVNTVVTKRNNIIHHNDKAMDVSFSDLLTYVDVFLIYIKAIDDAIIQSSRRYAA